MNSEPGETGAIPRAPAPVSPPPPAISFLSTIWKPGTGYCLFCPLNKCGSGYFGETQDLWYLERTWYLRSPPGGPWSSQPSPGSWRPWWWSHRRWAQQPPSLHQASSTPRARLSLASLPSSACTYAGPISSGSCHRSRWCTHRRLDVCRDPTPLPHHDPITCTTVVHITYWTL